MRYILVVLAIGAVAFIGGSALGIAAFCSDEIWRIRALENVTLTNPRTGEPILRG